MRGGHGHVQRVGEAEVLGGRLRRGRWKNGMELTLRGSGRRK